MRFWIACKMTIVLTVLLGIVYPLVMTGVAHLIFPYQADGSLITHGDRIIGSSIIGQEFSLPQYFHGRPSAAGDKGYDASSSSGSNLGPTNKSLIETVMQRVRKFREKNLMSADAQVPVDLVTASGSGLDPEITPAAAESQVARVSKARGLSREAVDKLIARHTRPRWLGLFGESGVNVLELNLSLDQASQKQVTGTPVIESNDRGDTH